MPQPLIVINISVLLTLFFSVRFNLKPPVETDGLEVTCAYPLGKPPEGARCMGYSPCNACSTCEYCAHCTNGGSCGICLDANPTKSSKSNTAPARSMDNSSAKHFTAPKKNTVRSIYLPAKALVAVPVLNVRSGPSAEHKLLAQLVEGDSVLVTETAGDSWVKIEVTVFTSNGIGVIDGYVYKNYLKF